MAGGEEGGAHGASEHGHQDSEAARGDATQTNRLTRSRGANILSAIRHTVP